MADGFFVGPIYIRFFGILIMAGVLAGTWLSTHFAKQNNEEPEIAWDMLVNLMVGGIIGARFWHILTPTNSSIQQGLTSYFYLTHPLDILAIWDGGLGVPGALIGGAFALWRYTRKNELSFAKWADIISPGIALAQAIGRTSDYFNQQIYGIPTNLPWKIFIDPSHRLTGYENIEFYHPLFGYEIILNIINAGILIWIFKRYANKISSGNLFILYIFNYSLIRVGLEFLRLDTAIIAGYNVNQFLAALCVILAGLLFAQRHYSNDK